MSATADGTVMKKLETRFIFSFLNFFITIGLLLSDFPLRLKRGSISSVDPFCVLQIDGVEVRLV